MSLTVPWLSQDRAARTIARMQAYIALGSEGQEATTAIRPLALAGASCAFCPGVLDCLTSPSAW